jgi:peptidoglycan/xylan/chitin deacetylase (PgdA/CDA1 family)
VASAPVTVTTSWDDGHRLDVRLADLLREHGIAGTFYIAPESREIGPADRLSQTEIRSIAADFEIGAHTMTHPFLPSLADAAARAEIMTSRSYLQDVSGQSVNSFCYPSGAFAGRDLELVRAAGFGYARTVQRFALDMPADPLQSPTTVHAYTHLVDIAPVLKYAHCNPLAAWRLYRNWDQLAMRMFDQACATGGVYHLWGHSWEIDRNRQWPALAKVLSYISARPGARYVANGEVSVTGGVG